MGSTPSSAIAASARASCSGVTETPWPNGMLPIEDAHQASTGGIQPLASPGKSTPVLSSSPNREK